MYVNLPYGKGKLTLDLPSSRVSVLTSRLGKPKLPAPPEALARRAVLMPLDSPPLDQLARGKKRVTILLSDHTRPVPTKLLLPPILESVRRGSPAARITLLIATGCHRAPTESELRDKLGDDIYEREHIVCHDCDDAASMVEVGTLPSGGTLLLNRLAVETDLLVAEGLIEPHFFAGFSGGRKSVLPGVAARSTVCRNHNAAFISDEHARAGILDANPIHRDMLWAARRAGLAFIVNAVLTPEGDLAAVFAGSPDSAHRAGTSYLAGFCRVKASPAPITLVSNGGYPFDQNLYQAVKGISTAEAVTTDGGVIIMAAECSDGIGGGHFERFLLECPHAASLLERIGQVPADLTEQDQWQVQILARVMAHRRIVLVSSLEPGRVRSYGMIPAGDVPHALRTAEALTCEDAPINVIPNGICVIASP